MSGEGPLKTKGEGGIMTGLCTRNTILCPDRCVHLSRRNSEAILYLRYHLRQRW